VNLQECHCGNLKSKFSYCSDQGADCNVVTVSFGFTFDSTKCLHIDVLP